MLRRALLFVAVAAALLLSTGAGCAKKLYPPEFLSLPDTAYANVHALCRLVATGQSYDSARYIVDWGDGLDTTDVSFRPADTAYVGHMWMDTGQYEVRTRTLTAGARHRLSAWSAPETVQVAPSVPNYAPVIDSVGLPLWARPNEPCTMIVFAHDADGDSLKVRGDWGFGDTTTGFLASPCTARITLLFTRPETAMVLVELIDWKGTVSDPETVYIPVRTAGGVIWHWLGRTTASPLVISDSVVGATLTGHPAFCEQTQHIIVGGYEGGLSALNPDLSVAWQWPDSDGVEWGAPAISGDRIYLGNGNDTMYYFIDSVDHGVRVAAFTPHASFVDAPVIDAQGNVYFGTDSGYLYKMGPELDTVFWRTHLLANGEIRSPVIGGDGTVYCASESSRLYAIDPATGILSWTVTLDGDVQRPAMGQTAIFVGSDRGGAYSINPATGGINWQKTLKTPYGPDEQFSTTPIVTANGYVYIQSENDVLYCLNQADGTVIWYCDCPRYLPRTGGNSHRPRKTQLTDYLPNPTITANGNIIVPGAEALYCVAGYPERPLDPFAPWPKWQHDLYNTGFVGGGK